jgi:predicted nucleic acid-binding protein
MCSRLSTDDFAGTLANQTNLAIKGTVGIMAMSKIAGILGLSGVQSNYSVCFPIIFKFTSTEFFRI